MTKLNVNKKKTVYVVTMYKFGERDLHSYIMGVFSKKQKAINIGIEEESYRGGKYKPEITEWLIDKPYKDPYQRS